jgi:archaeoflavoprotein AfpA
MLVRVAWAITGAGDYLPESVKVMKEALRQRDLQVTVFLSKAGAQVVKRYGLWNALEEIDPKPQVEVDANTPFLVGPLQKGVYRFLVVMPATANTVAKIVVGIADTLVTNCVAEAQKADLPIVILPCDQKPGQFTTSLPSGQELTLRTREVDLANVEKLRTMKGVTVLKRPEELLGILQQFRGS